MRILVTASVLALSLTVGSCSDAPTEPQRTTILPDHAPLTDRGGKDQGAGLLRDMRISAPVPGGMFVGTVSIVRFDFDEAASTLTADILVDGKAIESDGGIIKTADGRPAVIPPGKAVLIKDVPVTLTRAGDVVSAGALIHPAQRTACPILALDLGPIHLDLLGLVLDTSAINIDLTAQPGPGNLLGNLLCALLGLLDPLAAIVLIQQLLTAINNLLGAIGGAAPLV
jgi:hypothetical protein